MKVESTRYRRTAVQDAPIASLSNESHVYSAVFLATRVYNSTKKDHHYGERPLLS